MKMSEQINDLAMALSKAQGQMRGALKDSSNPFFKSKYADLASVVDAYREPFAANGLAMIQTAHSDDKSVTIVTMLTHSSGQWISDELTLIPKDMSPQSVGSAITYGRRYGAQSMAGVAPEDDDGNAASGKPATEVPQAPKIAADQKREFAEQVRTALSAGDENHLRSLWTEWDADEKVQLWSLFNSQERAAMKKIMGSM